MMTTPVKRSIMIATGSRADWGILRPVAHAIAAHADLSVSLAVTGVHHLAPAHTRDEVFLDASVLDIDAVHSIEMQRNEAVGHHADAASLARGVSGFADVLEKARPEVLLVLGDRIEALAAAATAAIAGIRVAHVHGGDRAEGVADEGMRHAISKLAHIHFAASAKSAERLICMGEPVARTHLTGSPAIDGLAEISPMPDAAWEELGSPRIIVMLHPTGDHDDIEHERMTMLLKHAADIAPVLVIEPNHDPGRAGIMAALADFPDVLRITHLGREQFIGLLRRARIIAGNSSAGLVEASAIPMRAVNIGSRQAGREKPQHVVNCPEWHEQSVSMAIQRGWIEPVRPFHHPYGDGQAGTRIAEILATFDPDKHPIAKRNTF